MTWWGLHQLPSEALSCLSTFPDQSSSSLRIDKVEGGAYESDRNRASSPPRCLLFAEGRPDRLVLGRLPGFLCNTHVRVICCQIVGWFAQGMRQEGGLVVVRPARVSGPDSRHTETNPNVRRTGRFRRMPSPRIAEHPEPRQGVPATERRIPVLVHVPTEPGDAVGVGRERATPPPPPLTPASGSDYEGAGSSSSSRRRRRKSGKKAKKKAEMKAKKSGRTITVLQARIRSPRPPFLLPLLPRLLLQRRPVLLSASGDLSARVVVAAATAEEMHAMLPKQLRRGRWCPCDRRSMRLNSGRFER